MTFLLFAISLVGTEHLLDLLHGRLGSIDIRLRLGYGSKEVRKV